MWPLLNRGLNTLFDLWLWPVAAAPVGVQLTWLALPAALLALGAYRLTTDPEQIERAKDRMKACLLELRIFRDDPWVMLRAQGRLLRHNLTYLRCSLGPLALMLLPFTAMLVQVEARFGYRPLQPGESALLTARVEGDRPLLALPAQLALPEGLTQETPVLRIESTRELVWRLRARREGDWPLALDLGASSVPLRARVGPGPAPVSRAAWRADVPAILGSPAALPLPADGPLRVVHLEYPRRGGSWAGLSAATWGFVGATLLLGLLLRRPLGVAF